MPPVLLHQAQNGWYDGLMLGPEAVNAHKTVGGTLNIANSGAGWGWGMEKEKGSWGKRKELERQKNCVGRKEIASKTERVPHADQGDIHLGSSQRPEPR